MAGLAENLLKLRSRKGLTQKELSDELFSQLHYRISISTLSQYENGKRIPEIATLIDLANYYSISLDELIGRTPLPKSAYLKERDIPYKTFVNYSDTTVELRPIVEDMCLLLNTRQVKYDEKIMPPDQIKVVTALLEFIIQYIEKVNE